MKLPGVHHGVGTVGGYHIQPGEDQSTQGLGLFFSGEFHLQRLGDVLQSGGAGDAPQPLFQRDDLLLVLRVELVIYVAHKLFNKVFHGDDTAGAAVLVHYYGKVSLSALHIPKENVGPHRLGDKIGLSQQFPQRLGTLFPGVEQIIPGVEDADDVVGVLLINGKAGEAGVTDGFHDLLVRVLRPEHDHIGAVDHHLGGGGVVELKDILNELPLLLLDFAGFFAHVHHLADIRLADPLLEMR